MKNGRLQVASWGVRDEWLALVEEDILEPERPIVDPHHHLWSRGGAVYELDRLGADLASGHNVVQTVFIECFEAYREDGPEHLRPIGETEYVARLADTPGAPRIDGIVAGGDMRHPDYAALLDGHEAAAGGRLRGVRHSAARDAEPETLTIPGRGPERFYDDAAFRRSIDLLGERGLTYDAWHYHHQIADFRRLAAAHSETVMVMDHLGCPLGVGRFAGQRDEIFAAWKDEIAALAELPNVRAKLGGFAMPDNGWGWHERDHPPGSDEFAEAQAPWHLHMIACFGADRCMFESNFPVDRASISYPVLWNGFKKIAADLTEAEKTDLFSQTARRVYRLPD